MIAIYPRNELLKDQLNEAVSEVMKLQSWLHNKGKRSLRIGAYYGDTPTKADVDSVADKWNKDASTEAYICPYFLCPNPDCPGDGNMLWHESDIRSNRTKLQCKDCHTILDANIIALTRDQMQDVSPDILFTTTEMLNRKLSNAGDRPLFGINNPPPRYMLLDEIHTYEGLHGAQVAYLLRRWQHAAGYKQYRYPLTIVGLSATLEQAEEFFSNLTGIPTHKVFYISPLEDSPTDNELVDEGAEYNIVLRGESANQTSLLSTSIQTIMLLARMLDTETNGISNGAYEPRIFAFADKLDLINRWYLYLQDAEQKGLPALRSVDNIQDARVRRAFANMGQSWQAARQIGNDLNQLLPIGRTTSSDRGVNPNAKVIISSSTLEVGFNDPTVGAVVQHKAPRDMASFLQRKGRAGRNRLTRPWTVVVTSGFGKDRWAFQHSEQLFSPILPPNYLPTENIYIQKIQATFAALDWIAQKINDTRFDGWRVFSSKNSQYFEDTKKQISNLIDQVLTDEGHFVEFSRYLEQALDLSGNLIALHTVLWGEPRPIMTDVLPTISRQISSKWSHYTWGQDGLDFQENSPKSSNPLPEYVPSSLFSDLNLPEVELEFAKVGNQEFARTETMSLTQVMTEYPPLNVNFRHNNWRNESFWFPLPEDYTNSDDVDINMLAADFAEPLQVEHDGVLYHVYRPLRLHIDQKPYNVGDSGYSSYIWKSKLEVGWSEGLADPDQQNHFNLQKNSRWNNVIDKISTYLHDQNHWVTVTRSGVGFRGKHYVNHQEQIVAKRFVYQADGEVAPAAVGYQINVDGIAFGLKPFNPIELRAHSQWAIIYQSLAPEFFRYLLKQDEDLAYLTQFDIDDLWLLEMSMLSAIAVSRRVPLIEAARIVDHMRAQLIPRTLEVILQTQVFDTEPDQVSKRQARLEGQGHDPRILSALSKHREVLWKQAVQKLDQWLNEVYQASIAAILLQSVANLVDNVDPDQLVVDIQDETIWITERTGGGIGLISRIVSHLFQHPRDLDLQLFDCVKHCEREYLDNQLQGVKSMLELSHATLTDAFARLRQTNDIIGINDTKNFLSDSLQSNGIPATRQLMVSLNSKFLRPNSDTDSDKLLVDLMNRWREEEYRLGIEIDIRVFSVAILQDDIFNEQLNDLIKRIDKDHPISENQRFNLVQSMLWSSCHDSCPECIEFYNPYEDNKFMPSWRLLKFWIYGKEEHILYGSSDWELEIVQALTHQHSVSVSCQHNQLNDIQRDIFVLLTTPIENGFQLFYPVVERIERTHDSYIIYFVIRELVEL